MSSLILKLEPVLSLTSEQFAQISQQNPELRLELSATGGLIFMPPTGGETGRKNFEINGQLWSWNQHYQLGVAFDSSTAFALPNGSIRSPDAAWIALSRWNALSLEQKEKFSPISPDFVIELLSPSDSRKEIQAKLEEYLDNSCQLGWLIDPQKQQVEIYRSFQEKEVLEKPQTLSGEAILPGFILNLAKIWS